jgi:hypothetical protein
MLSRDTDILYTPLEFNITGPELISPLPLIGDQQDEVPKVIIPSFQAACSFTSIDIIERPDIDKPCQLDPASIPSYMPKGALGNWSIMIGFRPSEIDRWYGLGGRFTFTFWSEYG